MGSGGGSQLTGSTVSQGFVRFDPGGGGKQESPKCHSVVMPFCARNREWQGAPFWGKTWLWRAEQGEQKERAWRATG